MYDVVLLDLDLTLFDFEASEVLAFADCMTEVGIDDAASDRIYPRYREINGALWSAVERGELTPSEAGRRRFEQLLAELGIVDGDPVELGDRFQAGLGAHGELYDGAAEVLDALASRFRLGLVTNGLTGVQRTKVRRLGLARWFEAIVISDEVGVAKPDPLIFELVLERLGAVQPVAALMVGDSLSSDVAGANAAGIASCWLNRRGAPRAAELRVDHEITSLDELVERIT